jgi:Domain of unknown function (DUF4430)
MRSRRGTSVASALLALLAAAGCGLGPGADVGDVRLTVTRDYGRERMAEATVAAKESDTAMRVLEGEADVSTRYGGGFVHAIDGVAEESRGGDPYDWFFYVDGEESEIGAADYPIEGDERIWWDYRNWSAINHIPEVVGSWPAPFESGIGGKRYPVAVECAGEGSRGWAGACEVTREALQAEGIHLATGTPEKAIRVLVGPWSEVRRDPIARLVGEGPTESGVFAEFRGNELVALDEGGETSEDLGPGAGLVAATNRYGGLPVWVVTGGTSAAVELAAEALVPKALGNHYAIAVKGALIHPLPQEAP